MLCSFTLCGVQGLRPCSIAIAILRIRQQLLNIGLKALRLKLTRNNGDSGAVEKVPQLPFFDRP